MPSLNRKDVLAIVAHELRAPLGSVLNAVELMRHAERSEPQFASLLDMVARQTVHMSRLVDDLLDVTRISRDGFKLRKQRMDFREPLEAAIEATSRDIQLRGHKMEVQRAAHPIWMDGDATRLQQVIANLLLNSAAYTEPGGHIEVELEELPRLVVLRVRDDGMGIPPEALDRIFEPFTRSCTSFRASHEGLGIGLAVVQSVVQLHGGAVEARSAGLQRGSEFIVRLPTLRSGHAMIATSLAPGSGIDSMKASTPLAC
jgi:signal transduction histidine kinase